MAAPRTCDACGSLYQPLRQSSRYCSGRCRKRAQRAGVAVPKGEAQPAASQAGRAAARGTVHAATLLELRAAKLETTALGQALLAAAKRVDASDAETGSAYAALSREFRAAHEAALGTPQPTGDVLDELAEQRRKRLAGGGA